MVKYELQWDFEHEDPLVSGAVLSLIKAHRGKQTKPG